MEEQQSQQDAHHLDQWLEAYGVERGGGGGHQQAEEQKKKAADKEVADFNSRV